MLSPLCGQSRRSGQSHSKLSTRLDNCCKRCHGNLTASLWRSPPARDRRHRGRRRPHCHDALRRRLRLTRARLFTELSAAVPKLPAAPAPLGQAGSLSEDFFPRGRLGCMTDDSLADPRRPAKTNTQRPATPTVVPRRPRQQHLTTPAPARPLRPGLPPPRATGASLMTPLPAYQIKSTRSQ